MGGKRIALLLLVLHALVTVPGRATPGAPATLFQHVKRDLLPGDRYTIFCDGASTAENGSYVTFFVLTSRSGTGIFTGQGESKLGHDSPVIRIRVADQDVPEVALPPDPDPQQLTSPDWSGTALNTSTLRVAWASWNTPMSCDVTVNGAAIQPADLELDEAVQARLHDFSGGASADAELAGAGAGLAFTHDVDGFVYSWLWAQGSATNRGPDQASASDSRYFWVGPSTGTWTHTVTAGYALGSVRGFILETPR